MREFLTEATRYRWVYVQLLPAGGSKMEIAGWVLPNADKIRASLELVDVARDPFLQRVLHTREVMVEEDFARYRTRTKPR